MNSIQPGVDLGISSEVNMKNKNLGSDFDDFLKEQNMLSVAEAVETPRPARISR